MRRPDSRFSRPLLFGLLVAILSSPAWAGGTPNTIAVSTTSDAMDAFDQQCSLREALANANSNTAFSPVTNECAAGVGTSTDTIALQSGATYSLTRAGADDAAGDLDVLDDPDLLDSVVDLRFETIGGDVAATISQSLDTERVVEIHAASTVFVNVVVRDGSVDGGGGGIYNGGGALILDRVSLLANVANSGAGLYNDGFATIIDSQVSLNEASLFGGGIFHGNGTMQLSGTTVLGNDAATGGGLYNEGGTLSIEADSIVSLNQATNDGGGIANYGEGVLEVLDSRFQTNTAGTIGGAIYSHFNSEVTSTDTDYIGNQAVDGGAIRMFSTNSLDIIRGQLLDNTASDEGGAINASQLQLTGTLLEGNSAGQGGAVYTAGTARIRESVLRDNSAVDGGAVRGDIVVSTGSRFIGNTATQRGGAVYASTGADIVEGRFSLNIASLEGGGLWVDGTFDSRVLRSLFEGNLAQVDGGGIWTDADTLNLTNTTISGNTAVNGSGSGLYIDDGGAVAAINVTLADNAPGENLAKFGELSMKNSIITSPGEIDCVVALENPEIDSLGNNLSDDDTCVGLDEVTDQTEVDALLAPLANNGGNTRTHALLEGSPALDTGDGAACDAAPVDGLDQRGGPRPPGFGCDIGAHEQEADVSQVIFADGFESP